jgi:hypothetical protein
VADQGGSGHQFDHAGLAQVDEALANDGANLASGAGNGAAVEVMVTQDEVDRPLGQGRQRFQGGAKDVALGNIARDYQRVSLLPDGLAELAPRGFAGMVQVDVGRPGEFHGLFSLVKSLPGIRPGQPGSGSTVAFKGNSTFFAA